MCFLVMTQCTKGDTGIDCDDTCTQRCHKELKEMCTLNEHV